MLVEMPIQEEFIDMEVSSDGSFLAALDARGVLRLYDMAALRSGDGSSAEFASADVGIFSMAITPDDRLVVSGASGALTARSVEEDLRVVWSIDGGSASIGAVEMNEGYVWTSISERLGGGDDVGLVGFPLDRGELLTFAASKLSRELTSDECQRYLGLDSCSDRRFASD